MCCNLIKKEIEFSKRGNLDDYIGIVIDKIVTTNTSNKVVDGYLVKITKIRKSGGWSNYNGVLVVLPENISKILS